MLLFTFLTIMSGGFLCHSRGKFHEGLRDIAGGYTQLLALILVVKPGGGGGGGGGGTPYDGQCTMLGGLDPPFSSFTQPF